MYVLFYGRTGVKGAINSRAKVGCALEGGGEEAGLSVLVSPSFDVSIIVLFIPPL